MIPWLFIYVYLFIEWVYWVLSHQPATWLWCRRTDWEKKKKKNLKIPVGKNKFAVQITLLLLTRMSGLIKLLVLPVKCTQIILFLLRVKIVQPIRHLAHCSLTATCSFDLAWLNIIISSAYICTSTSGRRSFTYILKETGPKMIPWGTPTVLFANEEHLRRTHVSVRVL